MKTSRNSHVWVLCGLALGFAALWTATAPIVASGSAVSGGWSKAWIDRYWTACEGPYDCAHCSSTYTDYCSNYDGSCGSGATIEVIEGATEGYTGHRDLYGGSPCAGFGGDCANASPGLCY